MKHCCNLEKPLSETGILNFGVPQKSILGPILQGSHHFLKVLKWHWFENSSLIVLKGPKNGLISPKYPYFWILKFPHLMFEVRIENA